MEKVCPICGMTLNEDVEVCPKCGLSFHTPTPVEEAPVEQPPVAPTAKFCIKCGNPLETGVAFCGKCGAPVAAIPTADTPAPAPQKPMSKKTKIILGVTAAVVAIAVILIVIFSAPSPKSAIENYVDMMNNNRYEDGASIAPEAYWNYLAERKGLSREGLMELYQNLWKSYPFEALFGSDYKISFEFLKQEKVDKATSEKLLGQMEKRGIDRDSVQALKKVYVEYTVVGELGEATFAPKDYYAVKIDGKWYVFLTENGFEFGTPFWRA